MRPTLTLAAAAAGALVLILGAPAHASGQNRDGVGIYSPAEPPTRDHPRAFRYDPRSWYYRQPGYYPYYDSAYWVPRADMRYRYRGQYYGPRYHYYPSWGYPLAR